MFASFGNTLLNIIAPLPEGEGEDDDDSIDEEEKDKNSSHDAGNGGNGIKPHQYESMVTTNSNKVDNNNILSSSNEGIMKLSRGITSELMEVSLDDNQAPISQLRQYHDNSPPPSSSSSSDSIIHKNPYLANNTYFDRPAYQEQGHSSAEVGLSIELRPSQQPQYTWSPPIEELKRPEDHNPSTGVVPTSITTNTTSTDDYYAMYVEAMASVRASEAFLQEAEHTAWHARAEASELLFSLELEQKTSADAKRMAAQLEAENRELLARNEELAVELDSTRRSAAAGVHMQQEARDATVLREDEREDWARREAALLEELRASAEAVATLGLRLQQLQTQQQERGEGGERNAEEYMEHEKGEIAELQAQLDSTTEQLTQSQKEQLRLSSLCTALREDAVRSKQQFGAQSDEGSEADEQLSLNARCQAELAVCTREKAALETALRARDDELARMKQSVEAYTHQLAGLEATLGRSQEESRLLSADLSRALQEKLAMHTALAEQEAVLAQCKQQIAKSEVETRQLHQVIGQLRHMRKAGREEEDEAQAERSLLREKVRALTAEVEQLRETGADQADLETHTQQLQSDLEACRARCEELEAVLDWTRGLLSAAERASYEHASAAENTRADALIARRELAQRSAELVNLQAALAAFERDGAGTQRKLNEVWQQRLEQVRADADRRLDETVLEWADKLRAQQLLTVAKEQRLHEEEVGRRKLLQDVQLERQKMQNTLETALRQLQNSREDVVDRTLVANLVVSYITRRRNRDVLRVLSKILSFTDAQMIDVGLKVAPTNLVDSFLSVLAPKMEKVDVQGDNLAEMWVNFLLEESGGAQSAGSTGVAEANENGKTNAVFFVGDTPKKIK